MGPEKWEMGFKRGFSRLKCSPLISTTVTFLATPPPPPQCGRHSSYKHGRVRSSCFVLPRIRRGNDDDAGGDLDCRLQDHFIERRRRGRTAKWRTDCLKSSWYVSDSLGFLSTIPALNALPRFHFSGRNGIGGRTS